MVHLLTHCNEKPRLEATDGMNRGQKIVADLDGVDDSAFSVRQTHASDAGCHDPRNQLGLSPPSARTEPCTDIVAYQRRSPCMQPARRRTPELSGRTVRWSDGLGVILLRQD